MDADYSVGCVEAQVENPSYVHRIETTARDHIPESYQLWRTLRLKAEYEAAFSLYAYVDNIEGSERLKAFLECRQYAYFVRHEETGEIRVVSNACRLRWCPVCSQAKSACIRQEVYSWLKKVRNPKFFTLTLAHSNRPLIEQVTQLYKHFRLFRQHRVISKHLRGGVWFFQLKRSKKSGDWHPHLHCLLDSDYIDKRTLSQEWLLTTGNSFIVDIRSVKDARKVGEYVSRYCAKPGRLSDFQRADQIEMFSVFHGKRLCGAFGTGREVRLQPRKYDERFKWQRLQSWSYVIAHRADEKECRTLLRAFLTNQTIPLELVSSLINHAYDYEPILTGTKAQIEDCQLLFKEFR